VCVVRCTQVVRTSLVPGLLKTLGCNKDAPLPVKIFEASPFTLVARASELGQGEVGCFGRSLSQRRVCMSHVWRRPADRLQCWVSRQVSDCVLLDADTEVGARNVRKAAALFCGVTSGFEVVHGLMDRLMEVRGSPLRKIRAPFPPGRAFS
jgi:phenylalanyl-tRNA synthetase beta subunit